MKKRIIRENDRYKSLKDGRYYTVVGDTHRLYIDMEDQEYGNVITVPKAAIEKAFIFEGNSTSFPVTKEGKYVVSDGQLYRYGVRVETDSPQLISILDYVDAGVYMLAKPKEEGTGKELWFYNAEKDYFERISGTYDSYTVMYNDRKTIGLIIRSFSDEMLCPENNRGKPERATSVEEGMLFLNGTTFLHLDLMARHGFMLPSNIIPCAQHTEKAKDATGAEKAYAYHMFYALDRKIKQKHNMDGTLVYIPESELCAPNTTLIMKISVLYDGYMLTYPNKLFSEACKPRVEVTFFNVDGKVKRISPVFDEKINALVVTDREISFSNYGHVPFYTIDKAAIDIAERYPNGLSLEVKENKTMKTEILTLCDNTYNMAQVCVVTTYNLFTNTITVTTTINEGKNGFANEAMNQKE